MAKARLHWRPVVAMVVLALCALYQPAGAQLPELGKFGSGGGGLLGGRGRPDEKVSVSAEFSSAKDGSPALLFVTAKIQSNFHLFAVDQGKLPDGGGPQPTEIMLNEGQPVKLLGEFRPIQPPKTHIDTLAWEGLELREHEGEVTWYAPIELAAGADPGSVTINGVLEGQACDPTTCIPIEKQFAASVGEGMPLPAATPRPSGAAESAAAATSAAATSAVDGLPLLTIAGYGLMGGLILNLMPCVLPVIGLKVMSFAKQGGQSRGHVLGLNLAYSAGLLSVFMVLATLAALAQLGLSNESFGWGELYTLTWFKVAMTALVFAMALSFLGIWELPIPGFATTGKATSLSAQEGPFGAFCMGVFTTLLATPCSGPFLGPVFGYTISQPPIVTYVVFGSVGVGMALPYLLIGVFPSLVSWLPKPGAWMETLKNLMGFILLATVVYLFSTINDKFFLATLALMFAIWFACWIIGRVPVYAPAGQRAMGWLGGVAVATVIGFGSFALLTPSESTLPWQPYTPQALAVARAQGKTVLVDFTADWCLTCKTNLKLAINREEVKELVKRNDVVTLLADWTDKNDVIKNALLELNSQSIPLLAIYPANSSREVIVLPDLLTQGDVLEALAAAGPSLDGERATVSAEQAASRAPAAPEFGAILPTAAKR